MTIPEKPDLASVRSGYDRWSEVYDHDMNPLVALEEPVVREALGDVRGVSVLDLGCGTGRHALWLAAAGASVTAVDFSEGMLAEARRKPGASAVRFVVHDLHEPLPFDAAAFDRVVSGLVLEHLHDLALRLRRGAPGAEAGRPRRGLGDAPGDVPARRRRALHRPGVGREGAPRQRAAPIGDFVMAAVRAGFALERSRRAGPGRRVRGPPARARRSTSAGRCWWCCSFAPSLSCLE